VCWNIAVNINCWFNKVLCSEVISSRTLVRSLAIVWELLILVCPHFTAVDNLYNTHLASGQTGCCCHGIRLSVKIMSPQDWKHSQLQIFTLIQFSLCILSYRIFIYFIAYKVLSNTLKSLCNQASYCNAQIMYN